MKRKFPVLAQLGSLIPIDPALCKYHQELKKYIFIRICFQHVPLDVDRGNHKKNCNQKFFSHGYLEHGELTCKWYDHEGGIEEQGGTGSKHAQGQ